MCSSDLGVWCARAAWVLLPLTAGDAIADATSGWATATARTAVVAAWLGWTLGLLALLAPRPWGLTALRVLTPTAIVGAILAAGSTAGLGTLALPHVLLAAILVLAAPVAHAAANALAYGEERRYPLRIPLALVALPVPLAALVTAGIAVGGPLLLASGRTAVGLAVIVIGAPVEIGRAHV